ncbi:MAG: hypothetical protein RI886_848 [Pseudomonadota bacterium]|jgi:hypothetical protein
MDKNDWIQLEKMHNQIKESGVTAFDSSYLEKYSELFAKSLEGKSDDQYLQWTSPS